MHKGVAKARPLPNNRRAPLNAIAIAIAIVALALLAAVLVRSALRTRRLRGRFQILDEIARVADGERSLVETLDAIDAILVPGLADFCTIDLITQDEAIRRASVRASGPRGAEIEQRLRARRPSLQAAMAGQAGDAPVKPRFYRLVSNANLAEFAEDAEDLDFLLSLGVRSSVTVELRVRGRVTGMLSLCVAWSGRRFDEDDAHFVWILSGRVALALDNAGLFSDLERSEHERAQIAETLQRGLLPPALPYIPGWSIAAIYRPAGAENEIGGDFYDAFPVSGGWMVVVGDVTGHGAHAASITAQARYTLRTAAALSGDPLVALATLNRALLTRQDGALCSVAAIALREDPLLPVRIAVAGHPPPLLIGAEGVVEAAASDPVLGAFDDGAWRIESRLVGPAQQLLVVTDGVTEAAGADGRFGEERLRRELEGASSPSLALLQLEAAVGSFASGEPEDDAVILAIAPMPESAAEPADGENLARVERLFAAFNRRDDADLVALCDPRLDFFPASTAEAVRRSAPYVGPAGIREYMSDVATAWEELLITPMAIDQRGARLLVRGRVYARSHQRGIRDMPTAWIWELRGGRFIRGEVYPDPERAVGTFDRD